MSHHLTSTFFTFNVLCLFTIYKCLYQQIYHKSLNNSKLERVVYNFGSIKLIALQDTLTVNT